MAGAILFVDDEPDLRFMAASYFEIFGYTILTAGSAAEAMQKSQGVTLSAIILDVNLPGESSSQLLAFLKKSHPNTPVMLYTGLQENDEAVQALLSQGADKYLSKDGSLQKVLDAVESVTDL